MILLFVARQRMTDFVRRILWFRAAFPLLALVP